MDSIDSRKQSFAQCLKMMTFDESFRPIGEFANILTLIVSTIGIFFAARVIFGDIADVGGTIFALLVLILLALIGGKCILVISWMIQNISKFLSERKFESEKKFGSEKSFWSEK